ncbi:MAG: hypothetical protein SGI72_12755 [Planctomycetota bacterium]|nr:hypothetical protein [Planctomycetota bacterium]
MKATRIAFVLALIAAGARAQSLEHAYVVDSGFVADPLDSADITIGFEVEIPNASWLRLRFSDIDIASSASLRIVSLADGAVQTHSQRTAEEWNFTSAYFNGSSVWVEVLAQPNSGSSRVRLESVTSGIPIPPAPSQCGPTDDRVFSSDPRVGRLQPSTCTAFLVDHCSRALMTAGHCTGGYNVVEFNVPISSAGGNAVHPPPSDQYAVDFVSLQSSVVATGSDWAIFGCFANPNTGKTPFEAQQVAFVRQNPPLFDATLQMRVTGFGNDLTPPSANFAQQTHAGPYFNVSGNIVRYLADTTGGNSGSPVILEANGKVIAIHTNGACDVGFTNANYGTSLANTGLNAALNNPLGVLSCNGTWSTTCNAQVNSQGCTPQIGAIGIPRVSGGAGSFSIRATSVINQQSGLLFYGINSALQPFQGGTLCVAAPLTRTPIANSGGSASGLDCTGVIAFDMGARLAAGVDPRLHVGATIFAQWWTRDALATPFGTNLSNAIRFTIGP